MAQTHFTLEVQPRIPGPLIRLEELANNLQYSWDRQVRNLFYRLNSELWETSGHNPKVFLRRVAQPVLEDAVNDRSFMQDYNRLLAIYDDYQAKSIRPDIAHLLDPSQDLVAYFCAEFGFHESVPIYSGGLGILAGDHCKAASDLGIPFIAVGLLYRQGYFRQIIDAHGHQQVHYTRNSFQDFPISPALNNAGDALYVHVDLPKRQVKLQVWKMKAGQITLYLLDTDLEENTEEDRAITNQLYGGDKHTRIKQEIVLGIGGVLALRALGLTPTVWHINEGHSAFQILERCRNYVDAGLDFAVALELVAAQTVFTTHTPVAAGHDTFDEGLMTEYFQDFRKSLKISHMSDFLALGSTPANHGGFNMTSLALRGSRYHNGVSRIHGRIASQMEGYVWPQISAEENPIRYVTNGVHVPTFLAREWANLFDMRFSDWRNQLLNEEYWQCIDEIDDQRYWSLHQSLKTEMLKYVADSAILQYQRNGCSAALISRVIRDIAKQDTETLVIGFARRFATYKRATLLFSDPQRLARLVNDPERPVIFIFAGKAHPSDQPGQHLIKQIHEFSQQPEFQGKIILLEDYDMSLARKLVTGVDVWLNTPEYPLEASGTSGQKAGINGVINLSVLDGWWGEGFNGENGWAITPHGAQFDPDYRNREEANDLLAILEQQIVPLYYQRDGHGYSHEWVKISKASMKSTIPQFNSQRMVVDYIKEYYAPAAERGRRFMLDDNKAVHELSEWKNKIYKSWPGVTIRLIEMPDKRIYYDQALSIRVGVYLNGLESTDVTVECRVGTMSNHNRFEEHACFELKSTGESEGNEFIFSLELKPELSGLQHYRLRMFPHHPLLSHAFEMGCMVCL